MYRHLFQLDAEVCKDDIGILWDLQGVFEKHGFSADRLRAQLWVYQILEGRWSSTFKVIPICYRRSKFWRETRNTTNFLGKK